MEVRGSGGQVWNAEVAGGFWGRFAGLMGRPPRPLLLATNRVHGFWLRAPVRLVAANRHGEVIEVRILARRRLAHIPGADWILELPLESPFPVPGDRLSSRVALTAGEGDGEPGSDARSSLSVRHPHRQPR